MTETTTSPVAATLTLRVAESRVEDVGHAIGGKLADRNDLADGQLGAPVELAAIRSTAAHLLLGSRPTAVARFVVSFVVDAVQRQPGRARPHVREEVLETAPAVADGDAPAAVTRVVPARRCAAPLQHALPRVVGSRATASGMSMTLEHPSIKVPADGQILDNASSASVRTGASLSAATSRRLLRRSFLLQVFEGGIRIRLARVHRVNREPRISPWRELGSSPENAFPCGFGESVDPGSALDTVPIDTVVAAFHNDESQVDAHLVGKLSPLSTSLLRSVDGVDDDIVSHRELLGGESAHNEIGGVVCVRGRADARAPHRRLSLVHAEHGAPQCLAEIDGEGALAGAGEACDDNQHCSESVMAPRQPPAARTLGYFSTVITRITASKPSVSLRWA